MVKELTIEEWNIAHISEKYKDVLKDFTKCPCKTCLAMMKNLEEMFEEELYEEEEEEELKAKQSKWLP